MRISLKKRFKLHAAKQKYASRKYAHGIAESIVVVTTLEPALFNTIFIFATIAASYALVTARGLRLQVAELACIFKFTILVPANGHTIAILLIIAASASFTLKTIVSRTFLFRLKAEIRGEEDEMSFGRII